MLYDHTRLKQNAKAAMAHANPKTWVVTLLFLIILGTVGGTVKVMVPTPFGEFFGQLAEAFQGAGLRVRRENTVTTDAVYRQTFYKEARWRSLGYAGVDMEASAAVSVCGYYGMGSAVALMASDKHPLEPGAPAWAWGNENFAEKRDRFLEAGIRLARDGL